MLLRKAKPAPCGRSAFAIRRYYDFTSSVRNWSGAISPWRDRPRLGSRGVDKISNDKVRSGSASCSAWIFFRPAWGFDTFHRNVWFKIARFPCQVTGNEDHESDGGEEKAKSFRARASSIHRLVDFSLQLAAVGFAQVEHGRFQGFVSQPLLNASHGYPGFKPLGRAGFAKTMEVVSFAGIAIRRASLRCLRFAMLVRGPRGVTLTAVQTGSERDALELPQEVPLGLVFLVRKNPNTIARFLALGQHLQQFLR